MGDPLEAPLLKSFVSQLIVFEGFGIVVEEWPRLLLRSHFAAVASMTAKRQKPPAVETEMAILEGWTPMPMPSSENELPLLTQTVPESLQEEAGGETEERRLTIVDEKEEMDSLH